MKKLLSLMLCLSFAPVYAGAADNSVVFDQPGSVMELISRIKQSAPAAEVVTIPSDNAAASKEWTVMIFVNAKNNLEAFGLKDVNEMEMIGSSDKVNIVAELGRVDGYSTADGDWKGSRRYLVKKDNDLARITSPVVMSIPKSDMGDWKYLTGFAKWAMEKYPAKHYALIVWNHGSGWNKDAAFEAKRGISYDDETDNHITTPQMREAMAQIGKIDIFSMDACLMQMMEVGYEIKDYADYIVASEETEPGDGYTYDTFLGPLVKKPEMSGEEFAKTMVDSYTDHYQGIRQSATQSAIKTASLGRLAALLDEWTAEIIAAGDKVGVNNTMGMTQSFYYSSNKDLAHFVSLINSSAAPGSPIAVKGKSLQEFLGKEVITHNRVFGDSYANAYGLAIYMTDYYSSDYDELKWAVDSKWDDFLKWLK